ncbi:hypothetical protein P153DRAFT_355774 [Dothidotthia symphoricarpi CBS 119687]|uniref:F-box domain-containing protein n=1 Tax=Dothidotthia symphoricarpi CBS 119687 TaxID=1392245 RepID=A0A6A6AJC3_9PLEO|nr:uncharacterized protein P153DRAFT_355774 [Dothidotthia symphoricarpi CBS 119687]KAF2130977.1 hypothetical protein P153DRAFT_355774 [Dothidotthia symphoricarpi CBS 119687]
MSATRPTTPPPLSYLPMTPPSTGRLGKRVRFAHAGETSTTLNSTPKRHAGSKNDDSPSVYFAEPQEGSDIELSEISEVDTTSSTDLTSLAPPSLKASIAPSNSILEKHDSSASLAMTIDPPVTTEPFPFMSLPLSIRQKVYKHLLLIPALICVRQKHTAFHDEKKAFLYAEPRELLPGIAYALAQLTVNGYKTRFSRFHTININVLRVSKEFYAETKAIMYGKNEFEIMKPTNEMSPPPDYSIRLFPPGCQRLVSKLNIRIRSFYDLHWLLSGGYAEIKNFYRGLVSLMLVLEIESAGKGFGKEWVKKEGGQEQWDVYIQRLHGELAKHLSGGAQVKEVKVVPSWINLRVLFSGESYVEKLNAQPEMAASDEQAKRAELKKALIEAWELFKKDCR